MMVNYDCPPYNLIFWLKGEVSEPPSHFDVKLLDGSAAVHFLSCNNVSTFAEIVGRRSFLTTTEWISSGISTNLTALKVAQEKGGGGGGRNSRGSVKLPRNFQDFLRDENKKEL